MMLREFVESLKPRPQPLDKKHVLPFIGIIGVVFCFYFASAYIAPGIITYVMSSVALLLMIVTAWARLNDITETTPAFQVRRLGLVLVIAACTGLIVKPFVVTQMDWPTWAEVMLRCGVTLVWMTTPMMPPWSRYIRGAFRKQVVEVGENVEVKVVRTETTADGGMFEDRRKENHNGEDAGP